MLAQRGDPGVLDDNGCGDWHHWLRKSWQLAPRSVSGHRRRSKCGGQRGGRSRHSRRKSDHSFPGYPPRCSPAGRDRRRKISVFSLCFFCSSFATFLVLDTEAGGGGRIRVSTCCHGLSEAGRGGGQGNGVCISSRDWSQLIVKALRPFEFFLFIPAFSLSRLWRNTFYPDFPFTVRAMAVRCLPPAQACPKKI